MILKLMAYVTLVALLFGFAALLTERAFAIRRWPRRWLWIASLLTSLVFPMITILTAHTTPAPIAHAQRHDLPVNTEPQYVQNPAADEIAPPPAAAREPGSNANTRWRWAPDLDSLLRYAWLGSSLVVLGFYLSGWLGLSRLARQWPRDQLDGAWVRTSTGVGPAVLGYFRPEIVVPRWVLTASPEIRAMVLAHEREHIHGRDPLLLLASLLLVAVAPWNLPLWWQMRRLRFAIEVDCDARALGHGVDVRAYGEMLLAVSQSRMRVPLGVVALTEPVSQLEHRIRALMGTAYRGSKWLAAGGVALAVSFIATAVQLTSPSIPAIAASAPQAHRELRKLPPEDISLGAQWAESAARERFPELFERHFDGTAVITVVLNPDGSVVQAWQRLFPAGSTPAGFNSNVAAMSLGAEGNDIKVSLGGGEEPITIGPWLDSKNPNRIDIVYVVLKWPLDPTRSSARVESAVRARFPELFKRGSPQESKIITVLMNENGSIERAQTQILPTQTSGNTTTSTFDFGALTSPEHFTSLGVGAQEIGRTGFTGIGVTGFEHLGIAFAWLKRPGDPPIDRENPFTGGSAPIEADTADDEAIVSSYFPDSGTTILRPGESRYLLLGRDGHVWTAGRGFFGNSLFLEGELEARFPGIKVISQWGDNCLGATENERLRLRVHCVWLTPDSPVTSSASVDESRRPDVFLTANVPFGTDSPTQVIATIVSLNYGHSAPGAGNICQRLSLCRRLRFEVRQAGVNHVELAVRLQSQSDPEIVVAQATARVEYDDLATVWLADTDSQTWRIGMRPVILRADQ